MKVNIVFHDRKMEIPVKSGIDIHYYGDLMYIKFDKPYCSLYFADKTKYTVEISLQSMKNNLPNATFMKCKRSAIVNLCYCKHLRTNPPGIVMEDGEKFKLSKQNVPEFRSKINNLAHISPPCPEFYKCRRDECESLGLFCRLQNKPQLNEYTKKE